MSLLMDALKKAEKEKQDAAKRITGEQNVLNTGEYPSSLDDSGQFDYTLSDTDSQEIPQRVEELEEIDEEVDSLVNTDSHGIDLLNTKEMALEPLGADAGSLTDASLDDSVEYSLENTAENEISSAEKKASSLSLKDQTIVDELPFEDTREYTQQENEESNIIIDETDEDDDDGFDKTLSESFENTMEQKLAGTASATQAADASYAETLNSVTASQLLKDIGQYEGQPTPVAANTVFEASKSSEAGKKFIWPAVAVALLLFVAIGSFFIFQKTKPVVPNVPSPTVAKGVEPTNATTLPSVLATTQQGLADQGLAEAPVVEVGAGQTGETVQVTHDELPQTGEEEWGPVTTETSSPEVKTTEADSAIVENETPIANEEIFEEEVIEEVAAVEQIITAPVQASISPAMIKISRIEKPKPEVSINQQAFAAYQQGNYAIAGNMYQLSLEKTPDNLDALLGLAAINLKQNNKQAAYSLYQRVLKLNPKDERARVAMINLQGLKNAANNESNLKGLLKDEPESASTHFSLGNLYAKQQRWPQAQSAFFEAFRRQSENPDYAMNLAVSLDQMGKGKAALQYYNKALELADKHPASFNPASVLSRIESLSTSDLKL